MTDVSLSDISSSWERIYAAVALKGEPYYLSAHLDIPHFVDLSDRVLTLYIPTLEGMPEELEWREMVQQCAIGAREALSEAIRFILGADLRVEFTTSSRSRNTSGLSTAEAEAAVDSSRASAPDNSVPSITLDDIIVDWADILDDLKYMSRVAWMAYSDAFPYRLTDTALTIQYATEPKAKLAAMEIHEKRLRILLSERYGIDVRIESTNATMRADQNEPTSASAPTQPARPAVLEPRAFTFHAELIAVYMDVPGTGPGMLFTHEDGRLEFLCTDDMFYRLGSFANRTDPIENYSSGDGTAVHLWAARDMKVSTPDRVAVPLFQIYLPEQDGLALFTTYLDWWGVPRRAA